MNAFLDSYDAPAHIDGHGMSGFFDWVSDAAVDVADWVNENKEQIKQVTNTLSKSVPQSGGTRPAVQYPQGGTTINYYTPPRTQPQGFQVTPGMVGIAIGVGILVYLIRQNQ